MRRTTIGLDVDDVCLELVPTWLMLYNSDWNDNVSPDDITEWNIAKFVKCGKQIYDYLTPSIYDHIPVTPYAVEGVHALRRRGYRVIFVTSNGGKTAGVKFDVLNRLGFNVDKRDYFEASDKSLIAAHFLIDDNYENVAGAFGVGIVFDRAWNRKYHHPHRVSTWIEIHRKFC